MIVLLGTGASSGWGASAHLGVGKSPSETGTLHRPPCTQALLGNRITEKPR